jgi:tetratricopeptide (TPR) repeat protein
LINVSDNTHLWASNYEHPMTQIFTVQEVIANEIAGALNVALLGSEQVRDGEWPTASLEAYDYYLKGRAFASQDQQSDAKQMFEKAINLDPSFSIAYAHLSRVYSTFYWQGKDQSPEVIDSARSLAQKAIELSPALPDGHIALGFYYYYAGRDYDQAMREFNLAQQVQQNNSDVLAAIGYVKRRQGKWLEAHDMLQRSVKLDPSSRDKSSNFLQTSYALGRWQEMIAECDRFISIDPQSPAHWGSKVITTGLNLGDTARARKVLEEAEETIGKANIPQYVWLFDVSVGDFEAAHERINLRLDDLASAQDSGSFYALQGLVYELSDEQPSATSYFDSARVCLEKTISMDSVVGHYPEAMMSLAKAYAGLGRTREALSLAENAVEKLPKSKDAYTNKLLLRDQFIISVMAGEYDMALDLLDTLMSVPIVFNSSFVRIYPRFDPLRKLPRFREIVEKHEAEEGK